MRKPPKNITLEDHLKNEIERLKKYRAEHPDKIIESRRKWDKKNRAEYQRNYRASKKTANLVTNFK